MPTTLLRPKFHLYAERICYLRKTVAKVLFRPLRDARFAQVLGPQFHALQCVGGNFLSRTMGRHLTLHPGRDPHGT